MGFVKIQNKNPTHSGYITVVQPYQHLCYEHNFSKLGMPGCFESQPGRYDFHSRKHSKI